MENKGTESKMRPTLVFGDVHGSTYWKQAVEENPGYRYVFLGDYLDPYEFISDADLVENLEEIIQLKKDKSDDVILLLGNHDLHYFCPDIPGSSGRYNNRIAEKVSGLFTKNRDLFTYAVQEDHHLFVHAGISHRWFVNDFKGDLNRNIADQLNNPTQAQLRPLHQAGEARGGSWFTIGGIFWADISELDEPLQGYTQYVGHNRVGEIHEQEKNGGKIVFCDCLYNKIYLRLE